MYSYGDEEDNGEKIQNREHENVSGHNGPWLVICMKHDVELFSAFNVTLRYYKQLR